MSSNKNNWQARSQKTEITSYLQELKHCIAFQGFAPLSANRRPMIRSAVPSDCQNLKILFLKCWFPNSFSATYSRKRSEWLNAVNRLVKSSQTGQRVEMKMNSPPFQPAAELNPWVEPLKLKPQMFWFNKLLDENDPKTGWQKVSSAVHTQCHFSTWKT